MSWLAGWAIADHMRTELVKPATCGRRSAVGQRQVGDVADVALVRRLGGEVAVEQVGHLLVGRLGHGGARYQQVA
jgi:hypothetical protein